MTQPEPLTTASAAELAAITAMCRRAKAHWGYDADFMAACVDEMTLRPECLDDHCAVIRDGGGVVGFVRLSVAGETGEIEELYVDPAAMGRGLGAALMGWARAVAQDRGVHRIRIVSDPHAEGFYARMGGKRTGAAPSGSIPGRVLPVLTLSV